MYRNFVLRPIFFFCITLFLGGFLPTLLVAQKAQVVEVEGRVKTEDGNTERVQIFYGPPSKGLKPIKPGPDGSFLIMVEVNGEFLFEFKLSGYLTRQVLLSTKVPPQAIEDGLMPSYMDILLIREDGALKPEPPARLSFNAKSYRFEFEDERMRSVKAQRQMAETARSQSPDLAKAEAERKAREEAEAKAKAEAERKAREEAEAKAEAERKAKEQADAAKAEAERKAREEAEAKAEAERKAKEQADAAKAEAERKAREEAEAERKAKEQADAAKAEAERKAREEAEAKAEAERKAKEQAEAAARAEAERKAREEAEAKAEAERKAKEQAEAAARAEAERKAKEEAEAKAEAERKAAEEAALLKAKKEAEYKRLRELNNIVSFPNEEARVEALRSGERAALSGRTFVILKKYDTFEMEDDNFWGYINFGIGKGNIEVTKGEFDRFRKVFNK